MHQPQIALLNQVQKIKGTVPPISLCNRNHQPQMGLDHLLARGPELPPGLADLQGDAPGLGSRQAQLRFRRTLKLSDKL
jgi:hypothetical protein